MYRKLSQPHPGNDTLYAFPYTADNGYFLYYDKTISRKQMYRHWTAFLPLPRQPGKQISMELTSGWYLYAFSDRPASNLV